MQSKNRRSSNWLNTASLATDLINLSLSVHHVRSILQKPDAPGTQDLIADEIFVQLWLYLMV